MALLASSAASAACSNNPAPPGGGATLGCDAVSPAQYYLDHEKDDDGAAETVEAWGRLRSLDPHRTAQRYTPADLLCWSAKADPLADYLIAAGRLGSTRVVALDDDVDAIRRDATAMAALTRAAAPRRCVAAGEDQIFFCQSGLPEAEYLLGLATSMNDPRREVLLRSAAGKGFGPAAQLYPTTLE